MFDYSYQLTNWRFFNVLGKQQQQVNPSIPNLPVPKYVSEKISGCVHKFILVFLSQIYLLFRETILRITWLTSLLIPSQHSIVFLMGSV